MKARSLELVEKSIAAMIAAIEVYNKPNFQYREETLPDGTVKPPAVAREGSWRGSRVIEFENGSIQVWTYGKLAAPTKVALRDLASALRVGLTNRNGTPHNTRVLGSHVLDAILAGGDPSEPASP